MIHFLATLLDMCGFVGMPLWVMIEGQIMALRRGKVTAVRRKYPPHTQISDSVMKP
jgi:hypothetical protein